ncbi:MAG: hypothetical protein JWO47_1093 [Candidatus Saccharibacteria bacterium]|nr:hypothetical protein [Candidatus Saccharibacteria bacterium]
MSNSERIRTTGIISRVNTPSTKVTFGFEDMPFSFGNQVDSMVLARQGIDIVEGVRFAVNINSHARVVEDFEPRGFAAVQQTGSIAMSPLEL